MTTEPQAVAPTKGVEDIAQDVLQSSTPWVVLLHNDDHNEMEYVVNSLCKAIDTLSTQEATAIMIEAHMKGVATVGSWRLELAEYYRDRIQTFGLTVTIEKA